MKRQGGRGGQLDLQRKRREMKERVLPVQLAVGRFFSSSGQTSSSVIPPDSCSTGPCGGPWPPVATTRPSTMYRCALGKRHRHTHTHYRLTIKKKQQLRVTRGSTCLMHSKYTSIRCCGNMSSLLKTSPCTMEEWKPFLICLVKSTCLRNGFC